MTALCHPAWLGVLTVSQELIHQASTGILVPMLGVRKSSTEQQAPNTPLESTTVPTTWFLFHVLLEKNSGCLLFQALPAACPYMRGKLPCWRLERRTTLGSGSWCVP